MILSFIRASQFTKNIKRKDVYFMQRITWRNLKPPQFTYDDITKYLVVPAIFENPTLKDKIQMSSFFKKSLKSLANNNKESGKTLQSRLYARQKTISHSKSPTEQMMELLLIQTSSSENIPYTLDTYPIRQAFKTQWALILGIAPHTSTDSIASCQQRKANFPTEKGFTSETLSQYKLQVESLISNSSQNQYAENIDPLFRYNEESIHLYTLLDSTKRYFQESHENYCFLELLATLSVIASTWYIWENAFCGSNDTISNTTYLNQIHQLSKMIFPVDILTSFSLIKELSDSTQTENTTDYNKEELHKEIEEILSLIDQKHFTHAGKKCEDIFRNYKNVDDHIIASILKLLLQCTESGYKSRIFSSSNDILKEIQIYKGSYRIEKNQQICIPINPAISSHAGIYVLNSENYISEWIKKTAPLNWRNKYSLRPENELEKKSHQRFILINEDYDVNLNDALRILSKIQNSLNTGSLQEDWENTEIYIRCNEELATPLLDTALNHLYESFSQDDSTTPFALAKIYLIDEEKRCVDYLFARHPHFYPLSFARNTRQNDKSPSLKDAKEPTYKTIHIVILSDNNNIQYATWLIREAFWTLPRQDRSIHSKITVLSPNATEICQRINASCPGLAQFSSLDDKAIEHPYKIEIEDITFPEISYRTTLFSNRALQTELNTLQKKEDLFYFIVDCSSDLIAIQTGITIRESAIRQSVFSGHISKYSRKNSIIAIRCSNPDYAGLINNLIVPKEQEHSNQWFNDYNFISFGSLNDIYSWDNLSEGVLETTAQCIHLQYRNSPFDYPSCKQNLSSYFKKLYNRESSLAAAISLPYRLFEAGIFPIGWYIQNKEAYWCAEARQKLSHQFNEALYRESPIKISDMQVSTKNSLPNEPENINQELLKKLAQYEHMRWCCYQLTRGWIPAKPDHAVDYMNAGVPRHVLQIAKIHPCICSWEELESLQFSFDFESRYKFDALMKKNNDYTNRFDYSQEYIKNVEKSVFSNYLTTTKGDYTFFQNIDIDNIKETSFILENVWSTRIPERELDHERH